MLGSCCHLEVIQWVLINSQLGPLDGQVCVTMEAMVTMVTTMNINLVAEIHLLRTLSEHPGREPSAREVCPLINY